MSEVPLYGAGRADVLLLLDATSVSRRNTSTGSNGFDLEAKARIRP